MSAFFSRRVKAFVKALAISGPEGVQQKMFCLQQLKETPLLAGRSLIVYHDALLFTCAYPANKKIKAMAEADLKRITTFLQKKKTAKALVNSGLPFTPYHSCFSHDCTRWLLQHPDCKISLSEFKDAGLELNDVLKLTLPSLLKSETTAGLGNEELMDVLQVSKKNRLSFLINELSKLDGQPFIKDQLFESLGLYSDIVPRTKKFSVSDNRIPVQQTEYRPEPVKSFDHWELFDRPVAAPASLNETARRQLVMVIKNSMALKDRETDTVTYMDERSLRLYHLEQGISIAIYGMVPERQMPLESYIGYTLFANGFPAAYGGAWVFGPVANFGINIFEAFRGAESGLVLCQLLRLYRQLFGIRCFEIEPYQFGLDNLDGIRTGAFWFYFKYGFRPKDKALLKLSLKEKEKIKANKQYRTAAKTLVQFTRSNIELRFDKTKPVQVYDITAKVILLISKKYKSDCVKAEAVCMEKFKTLTNVNAATKDELQVLKEVALWAEAFTIKDERKLKLLSAMVTTKPADVYTYQQLLLEFFAAL